MPHSLRAKIKGLQYKGLITDKDCDRLCKALDNEGVLDKIRAKIKEQIDYHDEEHRKYDSEEEFGISMGLELALAIVNKEVENATDNK